MDFVIGNHLRKRVAKDCYFDSSPVIIKSSPLEEYVGLKVTFIGSELSEDQYFWNGLCGGRFCGVFGSRGA